MERKLLRPIIATFLTFTFATEISSQETVSNHQCPVGLTDTGIVSGGRWVNLRQSPSINSEILQQHPQNARAQILREEDGWYNVRAANCETGYLSADVFHPLTENDFESTFDCISSSFGAITYHNFATDRWGVAENLISDPQILHNITSLRGVNIWLGYPDNPNERAEWEADLGVYYGFAMPPQVDWLGKLYFYQDQGHTAKLGEADIYRSEETENVLYILPFRLESLTPNTDVNGNWDGMHPCGAYAAPATHLHSIFG